MSRCETVGQRNRRDADRAVPAASARARYRAGIIGLGQIGNLFDEDPKRTDIWTHAGAYLAMPEMELVAGADPDADRVQRFIDGRGVANGYRDFREMLRHETLHLVSVCSPTELHAEMVMEAVKAGVKAIFCEKPLAATLEESADMIEACETAGVVLAVNHSRRWDPVYVAAKHLLEEGAIGEVESIVGYYPGHVYTMGTHLFDLMRWFGGDVEWVCGDLTRHAETDPRREPSLSGSLHFRGGAHGSIVCGRDRKNHIFELDLLGHDGRLSISGDGDRLALSRFDESPRYSGYRELGLASHPERGIARNRLMTAIRDILTCVEAGGVPACSGRDGMAAVEIAWALTRSATGRGQSRLHIPLYRLPRKDTVRVAFGRRP